MRSKVLLATVFAVTTAANAAQPPQPTPNDVVRNVVNNELRADAADHTHWMYTLIENTAPHTKVSTVVETANGNINQLDKLDGHPLTPEQKSAEQQRLQSFVSSPDQQKKATRASEEDDKKSEQMFAMLPDAFLFKYAQTEGDDVKYTFTPNPDFTSHSSQSYVFHKMDGFVIVNAKENRLVEIAGRLTNGIEFAGGLLGHLDPGGTFDVQRKEVGPNHWEITHLVVNMNGKILFFKTIAEQQNETHRNFQRIPDSTTLQQAMVMAEKSQNQPQPTSQLSKSTEPSHPRN
jgi:hypothetical protein